MSGEGSIDEKEDRAEIKYRPVVSRRLIEAFGVGMAMSKRLRLNFKEGETQKRKRVETSRCLTRALFERTVGWSKEGGLLACLR